MNSLDRRLAKLESAAGISGNSLTHLSDAELDELMIRTDAELLSVWREAWPVLTDIDELAFQRAWREFCDECAAMSLEQMNVRI